ncbi:MAG TPA: HAD-IIB family hydrolase [Vicinamibacterales bacterium]|nr:HAD-IIB family hydrolase [Vicinamibacterales bacterium]
MRYAVLAVDYDGTIASHGVVHDDTVAALETLKKTGCKLVLVTGREIEDLIAIFARLDLFDRVVGENGAVMYTPADRSFAVLGEPPPPAFVGALRARGVQPLSVGHVIVATWEPNQAAVLDAIRDLGLELQVIFNKGAVMVLPAGTNKATGLDHALASLQLSPHNAVGIGDAENDHAFLNLCEYAVATANAVPTLKERADWVTTAPSGRGVIELVDRMAAANLRQTAPLLRHRIELGATAAGEPMVMPTHATTLLVAGASGSGKSTVATAILEQLFEQKYQCCLIDPEGDYSNLEHAMVLGDPDDAPSVDDVVDVLHTPGQSAVAVLLGLPLQDRPGFFNGLLARLATLQSDTGRPHWIVLDEAHHLLSDHVNAPRSLPPALDSTMLITAHPEQLPPDVLAAVTAIVTVGDRAGEVMLRIAAALRTGTPEVPALSPGEALAWWPGDHAEPIAFRPGAPRGERRRHLRKYAEGTLGPDKSFFFRGPRNQLRLRAQNLGMFLQLADGVDDDTWRYHLNRGDYSSWVREAIKDFELADEIADIEATSDAPADASRAAVAEAIGRRYTEAG